MKKAIKHILFLCVLLLMGNSSLFAHALPLQATSSIPEKSNNTELENQFDNLHNITNPLKEFYSKKDFVIDNEEEDSEIISTKKVVEKTISYPQPTGFISNYTNNSLATSFCKEFFYLPSYTSLYLIFEVFRI